MLLSVGVDTIGKLAALLNDRLENLKRYAKRLLRDAEGALPQATCLFYLAQFIAVEEGGLDRLVKLHVEVGIRPMNETVEEGAAELVPMMLEAGLVSRN
jgi:hypothetical protein